jgi:mycothiol system anti-sigma-R factor
MKCEDVLLRVWEYLDQELAPTEARAVDSHLSGCAHCRPAYRYDRAFLEILARQRVRCEAPGRLLMRLRFLLSTSDS